MRLIAFLGMLLLAACTITQTPTTTPLSTAIGVTLIPTVLPIPDDPIAPTAIPTLPRIQDCPDAPPILLVIQERGQVIDDDRSLNLRQGPGIDYDIIIRMDPGEIFMVLDGPTCVGGYAWFRIHYDLGEVFYEGWIAEGDFEQYYVAPYLPG